MTDEKTLTGGSVPSATLEVFMAGQNAYAQPMRFVQMLDLWGERILSLGSADAVQLNSQLDILLETAAPQMEAAGATQLLADDLGPRLAEERRPAAAFTAAGVALMSNTQAQGRLALIAGTRLSERVFQQDDRTRLTEFLRRARDPFAEPRPSTVLALLTDDGRSALVELTAERAADTGETMVLLKGLDLAVPPSAFDALADIYHLTEAETLIAELTSDGLSPNEIAARRKTSVETVRTQIKSLREKTGARNQMDLLRTIAGLAPLTRLDDAARRPGADAYGMPRRHALVELPNGRRIEYSRIGPQGGRAIMVLHAALFGFVWPEALVRRLNQAGFTLWFPVRPGYGMSSPAITGAGFETDAIDLAEFADAMGMDEYCVVGQGVSAGAAIALAVRHHNRVTAVANLSGYLPMGVGDSYADMSGWQRAVLHAAKVSPRVMKTTSKIASRMMRKLGPHDFFAKTYANSPSDIAAIADPAMLRLLEVSLELLQAQGLSGLSNDFPRVVADWHNQWDQLRTPAVQIHGTERQIFPPDRVAAKCASHPSLRLELVEHGGQLLAYSHPDKVADLLLAHFRVAQR
jgi:pimeloyl-ACP methyl ester carboxylesterase/DNA-binding CsgD family transcriptional regulator